MVETRQGTTTGGDQGFGSGGSGGGNPRPAARARQPLDDTLADSNQKLIDEHTNAFGKETLVFQDDSGKEQVYPNVGKDRLDNSNIQADMGDRK
jgi:hypothetical protein